MKNNIILASASPRRRELLSQIGIDYRVLSSDAAEITEAKEPGERCRALACLKARDVAGRVLGEAKEAAADGLSASSAASAGHTGDPGGGEVVCAEKEAAPSPARTLIIGADTLVAADGKVLGKPADAADAKRMLRILSGREHQVYTGVCAVAVAGGRILSETSFTDVTDVFISRLTEADIDWYLSTGEPFDKAGAYGIQGCFARYVEKIEGDYNTVVGLPVGRLWRDIIRQY